MAVEPDRVLFSSAVPSHCFVLDEKRLAANAEILRETRDRSGAKILLALKAFAAWDVFPMLSESFSGPLAGTCASSVDEARLGKEKFGGEVHAFAAAWDEEEIAELCHLADHVVFNSLDQWRRFKAAIENANSSFRAENPIRCGLRINPEHSEGAPAIYNPCAPGSRLGIRPAKFAEIDNFSGLSGVHFHTLCEQGFPALSRTLDAVERKFPLAGRGFQWLNFGGGHHITLEGYDREGLSRKVREWKNKYGADIYLEPGEAVALDAGWLTATVLDIVEADPPIAILDISAACHMPDALEMPYTPIVWRVSGDKPRASSSDSPGLRYRLAGKSCLAGDVIGEYGFLEPLKVGERLVFQDMAIYSMVKTTTFNGLRLPSIGAIGGSDNKFRLIRKFSYEDFRDRLS